MAIAENLTKNMYMILIFVAVIFLIIGGFVLFAMLGPITFGSIGELKDVATDDLNNLDPNSDLSNATIAAADLSTSFTGIAEFMIYVVMISLAFGFILIALYVRQYPFLAYLWVFIVIFFVIVSIVFSMAYNEAKADPTLNNFYQQWGTNDFIMSKLPFIVTIFGVITGIVLFSLVHRDKEGEVVYV